MGIVLKSKSKVRKSLNGVPASRLDFVCLSQDLIYLYKYTWIVYMKFTWKVMGPHFHRGVTSVFYKKLMAQLRLAFS